MKSQIVTRGGHRGGHSVSIPAILAKHLAWPSGVNPELRARLPDQLVTAALLVDVTTGRDRARSGVDAVRCRRDDLRPAGMTCYRPQPRPTGT